MTPMCDVLDFNPDEGGLQLASLFGEDDVAQADAFGLDFGSGSPRVKLPKTAPFDPATELYSTEMPVVDSWTLGSPLQHRSSLSRSASLEFAVGKVKGLKRDASWEKIFVTPRKMATWGQDSSASSATDAPAAAPAPTASASSVVAPPVSSVPAPPAVAPAAPVTASTAPTQPETAPAPPKNKNKRKGAQKSRKAQAEEDAEDDATATAQSNTKTAQAAGTTQRSGAAASRAPAASSQAPATSSRAPSASTCASKSTARASAADDAVPYAPRAASRATRRAVKARRAMQSLKDAGVEIASGADVAEATSADGHTNAVTQDAANITPSPTRTPPSAASTTAPVLAPAGALDCVAASPQAQADVDEHTTTTKDNESSSVLIHVGVAKTLKSAPATQSFPTDQHPQDERAQQFPPTPVQSMPTQHPAHYAPPAPAHGYLNAQVPQSVDAAPRTRARAHGDVQLTPPRMQTIPDIDAIYIEPPANAFYPPHAPAYQGPVVPAPWYHNVVLAAQPHAMINGQPMLPMTMPPPPPMMYAPQVQHQTNAPAPANGAPAGAYHIQQASSTPHGLWAPPNYPTSTTPPAPVPYYNMGASPSGASGLAYPPMRTTSHALSSRTKRYTSFVDSDGMTRLTSSFPQRASGGVMPGSSSGATAGMLSSHAGQPSMDPLSVANLLAQSKETGIPDDVRKVVGEQFPEVLAKMRELSSTWALQDTTPPPQADAPNRDFSRGEPVLCKLNHGRDKPPCSHVFMVDRSQLDDDAYRSDYEVHVLEHLEHPTFTLWTCAWKGCVNLNKFMGTKNGIGHHVAEHIFKELQERILKERQEQILRERRERKEQTLKELQDLSGQPASKRARHN